MKLGATVPDFDLTATDGERFYLGSFSPDQLLVVLFLANHCPLVVAWEDRLIMLAVEHAGRGAAFVAVSSGDPRAHPQDGLEGMRRRANQKHYPFPYLYDEDAHLAREFGATITPEAFVFDHQRLLCYHGAIDSDVREAHRPIPYLRYAIEQLIAGTLPQVAETDLVGCPIESGT